MSTFPHPFNRASNACSIGTSLPLPHLFKFTDILMTMTVNYTIFAEILLVLISRDLFRCRERSGPMAGASKFGFCFALRLTFRD